MKLNVTKTWADWSREVFLWEAWKQITVYKTRWPRAWVKTNNSLKKASECKWSLTLANWIWQVERLLPQADARLLEADKPGRNQTSWSIPNWINSIVQDSKTLTELQALARHSWQLHPKASCGRQTSSRYDNRDKDIANHTFANHS